MDIATVIAIISLIVALLAFPVNYCIARQIVKHELNESERHSKQRARILVADTIDEFSKVFHGAVKAILHIEPDENERRLDAIEINPHIAEIDALVAKTGILERLSLAIDNLSATGFGDLPEDIILSLQSIRNQISLGSDTTRYATLGVLSCCEKNILQSALRKGKKYV